MVALLNVPLPVKGDNSTVMCNCDERMERQLLAINLTIADQKTEICELKARLDRLEGQLNTSAVTDNLGLNILQKIIDQHLPLARKILNSGVDERRFCPDGWVYFETQCYYFSKHKRSWHLANAFCAGKDGHLATADNEAVNIFIYAHFSRSVRFWIGGRKRGTDNPWQWTGNGNEFQYTAWCPEQPDGLGDLCLSFLKLVPAECYWTDRKCKFQEAFICQRPANGM